MNASRGERKTLMMEKIKMENQLNLKVFVKISVHSLAELSMRLHDVFGMHIYYSILFFSILIYVDAPAGDIHFFICLRWMRHDLVTTWS